MSKSWVGESDMAAALQAISSQRSQVEIDTAVNASIKYIHEFKMVVYEIEKFIKKAPVEQKLGAFQVLNSLCHQKDVFAQRFALRMKDTLLYMERISPSERATVGAILNEWKQNNVVSKFDFSSSIVTKFVKEAGGIISTAPPAPVPTPAPPAAAAPRHTEVASASASSSSSSSNSTPLSDPRRRQGNSSSFSSLDESDLDSKRRKKEHSIPGKDTKLAARLCPFRDGSCPYGDKCRYSHKDTNTIQMYANRLLSDISSSDSTTRKRLSFYVPPAQTVNNDSSSTESIGGNDSSSIISTVDTYEKQLYALTSIKTITAESNNNNNNNNNNISSGKKRLIVESRLPSGDSKHCIKAIEATYIDKPVAPTDKELADIYAAKTAAAVSAEKAAQSILRRRECSSAEFKSTLPACITVGWIESSSSSGATANDRKEMLLKTGAKVFEVPMSAHQQLFTV